LTGGFPRRGPQNPADNIILVGIDQDTRDYANRPSFLWSSLYADFIRKLGSALASGVIFDIVFPTNPDEVFREFVASFLNQKGIVIPPNILNQMSFDQPLRAAIYESKKKGPMVFLGLAYESGQTMRMRNPIVRTVPSDQVGYFNIITDEDRAIRSVELFSKHADREGFMKAIGLTAVSKSCGSTFEISPTGKLLVDGTPFPNLVGNREGRINFAGPRGTYKMFSFKDFLDGTIEKNGSIALFKGKTVLVGEVDITDIKQVPTGTMSGMEVHANIMENIMNRCFLKFPPISLTIVVLVILLFLQMFSFAGGIRKGAFSTLILGSGWTWACTWAFGKGLLLPFAKPLAFIILSGVIEGARQYRVVVKDRRRIREVFGRYVNDSVIKEILNRPKDEFMAGNRKLICVMFSDIRGFTSFSESRDPTEVVMFLNQYFKGLTEIILKHDGVVDKFLGDGLMAFFNAPIEKESFVRDAVSAAYEMRKFVEGEEIRKAAGSFDLKVGVALNVGYTIVGNIGSERKTEFTAIGDTVNTTSRMESLNKDFGTDIIASETVVEKAGGEFEWKFLAQQSIRGKEKTVKLYSLLGKKTETMPSVA